ncbi:MAG: hypothetical protein H0T62_00045 [Parachlamydiaceae bacterium]|nr:hypothetical protein [Parachlamydiaceae bacterium]
MFKKFFLIFTLAILFGSLSPLCCQEEHEFDTHSNVTSLNLSKTNLWKSDIFNNIFSFEQLEELHIDQAQWAPPPWNPNRADYSGYLKFQDLLSRGHFPKLKILSLDHPSCLLRVEHNSWYKGMLFYGFHYVHNQSYTLDYSLFAPNLEKLSLKGFNFTNELIRKYSLPGNNDLRDLAKLSLTELDLSKGNFEPEQIEQSSYVTISSLEKLSINDSLVKNFNFKVFAPNLKYLSLSSTNVNSKDVANISQLSDLVYLDLSVTKIPAGSLKKLNQLPLLQVLKLSGTNMTKADFSCLQSTLKDLDLSYCEMSIASFKTLSMLTQLEKLNLKNLRNDNITDADRLSLQEALPNCNIIIK